MIIKTLKWWIASTINSKETSNQETYRRIALGRLTMKTLEKLF